MSSPEERPSFKEPSSPIGRVQSGLAPSFLFESGNNEQANLLNNNINKGKLMMSLPEEQPPFKEPSSPIGRMQLGLAASFITPSLKKNYGDGDQFVDDKPLIDKRKPSSMMVERGVLNNGEHTLIPVMAKMILSAVWNSERFVLKDGQPPHMVKLVGFWR
jgi:hypothetical protein